MPPQPAQVQTKPPSVKPTLPVEKYLTLPGDVMVTIRPNRTSAGVQTFSLPNIHGDIFATIDADGKVLGTSMTGPFGEVLPNKPQVNGQTTSTPWNTLNGASFQYVGQHEKLNEVSLAIQPIQMGARVYIPGLGRFLSVDPVAGGTANPYSYVDDPVNDFDLDGTYSLKNAVKNSWKWVGRNSDTIGKVVAAGSFAACVVATAGACGVITVAAAAASAGLAVASSRSKGNGWGKSIGAGVVSGLTDAAFGRATKSIKLVRNFGKSAPRYYGSIKSRFNATGTFKALSTGGGRARLAKYTGASLGGYYAGQATQWGTQWIYSKTKNTRRNR